MNLLPEVHLPFTNPVAIFALVLLIILFSPIVLKRFKIPGIVGMIISGIIIGPKGLNLIPYDSSIILLGTIGLLYIMLLAALELDLNDFKLIKYQSFLYATLIIFTTITISFVITYYWLNYSIPKSIFIGLLLTPFTLISYPIVSRLGLASHRIVAVVVGTVVIIDVVSLTSITIVKDFATEQADLQLSIIKHITLAIVFLGYVVLVIPKIAKWFFKNIEEVGTWQYIFVLFILFASSTFAEICGFEPIIGAFASGLALNKYIPINSTLMDRINFVGTSLFIPFFLIQVGMIIDISVLFSNWSVLLISLFFLLVWFIAVNFSARITSYTFNFTKSERNLLISLTLSKAAAVLAIAVIGFKANILDEQILNAVVLLILFTSLFSSFFTEKYGKQIVVNREIELKNTAIPSQKIMVSVSNPENISRLIEFGIRIKQPISTNPIIVLTIANDDSQIPEKITNCQKIIAEVVPNISMDMMKNIIVTARSSFNVTDGIIRTIRENIITDVVLGLSPKTKVSSRFFGTILQNLLEDTNKALYVFRSVVPLNLINNLIVFIPENAEYEIGFTKVLNTIFTLARNLDMKIHFHTFTKTNKVIHNYISSNKIAVNYKFYIINSHDDLDKFAFVHEDQTMLLCVFSRQKGISYNLHYRNFVERQLDETENSNFALFYPEQSETYEEQDITHFDILDTSPIEENIVNYRTLVKKIRKLLNRNN